MLKLHTIVLVALLFPMISGSQVNADVPTAASASSRMDLDVSPLVALNGAPDPLPELGIHLAKNPFPPKGPSREEKIEKAAHWLKAAAGASPLLIESGDIGFVVHLTGDPQLLQQLKDAVDKVNPPNAPHVMFDCRVFTMSNEAMAKLDEGVRKKLLAAMVPGSVNAETITNEQRVTLSKAATTTITAPRLTLFDGQSGYAIVATQRAFVAGIKKIPPKTPALLPERNSQPPQGNQRREQNRPADDTQPTYDPELGIVDSGVAVGAKVDVKPADKTIAVQVKTQVARLLELKTTLADPEDKNTQIQVPTLENMKFDQLCTVADGESILCHGEREIINGPTTQPVGDDVFFIITATIVQPQPKK